MPHTLHAQKGVQGIRNIAKMNTIHYHYIYLVSLCVGKTLFLPSPSLHVSCLLICRPVIKIIIQAGITRDAKRKYFTSLSSVHGEILQFQ